MFERQWIVGLAVAVGLGAAAPGTAIAKAAHPTATFGVFASTSIPGGVDPTHNPGDTFYKYTYMIPSGAALSDSIPILVCLDAKTPGDDGSGNPVVWGDEVALDNISGAFSADVSVTNVSDPGNPWGFLSSDPTIAANPPASNDPACQMGTVDINVPANTLTGTPGTGFTTNVIFKNQNRSPSTGATSLQDNIETPFKIMIFVEIEAIDPPPISCFMTDSDGNFLLKADGTPANMSGETDGTFTIVTNAKGKAVATNPGQFYYNLLWQNSTDSPATVTITLADTNVVPNGTQALHWQTFPTAGFAGVTAADFDAVNEGNPAGMFGPISNINVPAGYTLYVTQHLEWAQLGKTNFTTDPIKVTGTVTPPGDTCMAGAVVKQ